MTALVFDQRSIDQFAANASKVSRGVRIRQTRIALNAWGGVVKTEAVAQVKKISGFLSKSLIVKVTIPDASRDPRHHGRPARAMVGASRKAVKAQAIIGGKYKFLSIRKATKRVLAGGKVRAYKPSRYAHFVEKGIAGRKRITPNPFIARAQAAGNTRGMAKLAEKLTQGIAAEAARLTNR
jgi:hypothetical protein